MVRGSDGVIYYERTAIYFEIYYILLCSMVQYVSYLMNFRFHSICWSFHSFEYMPLKHNSSSCVPLSTTFPLLRTIITSALFAVDNRCAIISVVLPSQTAEWRVNMFRWISRSVPESMKTSKSPNLVQWGWWDVDWDWAVLPSADVASSKRTS